MENEAKVSLTLIVHVFEVRCNSTLHHNVTTARVDSRSRYRYLLNDERYNFSEKIRKMYSDESQLRFLSPQKIKKKEKIFAHVTKWTT